MTSAKPIDLPASLGRSALLIGGACAFVALCAWFLYARPPGLEAGGFREFVLAVGVLFFALCAVVAARRVFRTGPLVSVGPLGIFDRRLSTDWIPWDAITAVGTVRMQRNWMLVLRIDPDREAGLPFRAGARRLARMNSAFGVYGYWMSAGELRGGFQALQVALAQFGLGKAAP